MTPHNCMSRHLLQRAQPHGDRHGRQTRCLSATWWWPFPRTIVSNRDPGEHQVYDVFALTIRGSAIGLTGGPRPTIFLVKFWSNRVNIA